MRTYKITVEVVAMQSRKYEIEANNEVEAKEKIKSKLFDGMNLGEDVEEVCHSLIGSTIDDYTIEDIEGMEG